MPNRPENQSEIRRQLAYAGFYGPTFARVLGDTMRGLGKPSEVP